MTSPRALKVLTFLSLLATAAATVLWYYSGQVPAPWLMRFAAATFALALIVGLVGQDTRPRVMLRFLAALFALATVIAFAADITRQKTGGGGFSPTSLLDHISTFAPSLLASAKTSITRAAGARAWDPVLTSFLGFPAFLIFGLLAAICGYAGRPHREIRIFIN